MRRTKKGTPTSGDALSIMDNETSDDYSVSFMPAYQQRGEPGP